MKNSFGYFLKTAFQGLRKNFLMTVASVSVLIACMLIIGTAYLFSMTVAGFLDTLERQNEIVAFIDETVAEEDLSALKTKVESLSHVESVTFVTKEQALEEYREQLGEDGAYLDSYFGEDNPLRDSLVIAIDDIEHFESTSAAVAKVDGIARVRDSQQVVDFLLQLRSVVGMLGFWIMLILGVVALFIIANTIKIAMYNRRNEISIMRYVGATNGFIRLPFLLEGLMIGIFAAAVCFGLQWYVYTYLISGMLSSLPFVTVIPFSQVYWHVLILFGSIGVIVGTIGSFTSIGKYLKA